jgi:hypothetical protein
VVFPLVLTRGCDVCEITVIEVIGDDLVVEVLEDFQGLRV